MEEQITNLDRAGIGMDSRITKWSERTTNLETRATALETQSNLNTQALATLTEEVNELKENGGSGGSSVDLSEIESQLSMVVGKTNLLIQNSSTFTAQISDIDGRVTALENGGTSSGGTSSSDSNRKTHYITIPANSEHQFLFNQVEVGKYGRLKVTCVQTDMYNPITMGENNCGYLHGALEYEYLFKTPYTNFGLLTVLGGMKAIYPNSENNQEILSRYSVMGGFDNNTSIRNDNDFDIDIIMEVEYFGDCETGEYNG